MNGEMGCADRQRLAEVLDPDAFDESRPRSKHHAAVVQWAARQHMAHQGADRLLAAGVFRSEAEVKAEVATDIVAEIERCADVLVTEADDSGHYLTAAILQKASDIARVAGDLPKREAALRAGDPS